MNDYTQAENTPLERHARKPRSRKKHAEEIVQQTADHLAMPAAETLTKPSDNVAAGREPGDDSHAATVGRKQFKPAPDPFGAHTIMLSPDGLQARFLRDKEYGKILIQFNKNPGKEVTDPIGQEGFGWKPHIHTDFAKGAWVLDLQEGQEWRGHAHAEQVFQKTINQVREANGMDPWVPGAGQAPAPF